MLGQTNLNLCWEHMSEGTFSDNATKIKWTLVTTIAFVPKDIAIKIISNGKKSLNAAE